MYNHKLEKIINKFLQINKYQDNVPNGLQVEGKMKIKKIIMGVSASQLLLNRAVKLNADAIIVHHGYFWKNENPVISNIKRKRLKTLLVNNINLYSYHLPLDVHPTIGNNVQLGNILGIKIKKYITPLLPIGEFENPITPHELILKIKKKLGRMPLHIGNCKSNIIHTISWCTGAGQNFIQNVTREKIDAFITGEVSEQTTHIARETKIHFFAAGHHATERLGIKKLGDWIQKKLDLEVVFIDIHNPV